MSDRLRRINGAAWGGPEPVVAALSVPGANGVAGPGASLVAGQVYVVATPIFRLKATGIGTATVTGTYADGSKQTLAPVSAGDVSWYGDDRLVAVSWSGPATLTVGVL